MIIKPTISAAILASLAAISTTGVDAFSAQPPDNWHQIEAQKILNPHPPQPKPSAQQQSSVNNKPPQSSDRQPENWHQMKAQEILNGHQPQQPQPQQQSSSPRNKPPPLPNTDNPYTLLGFDWMAPPKDHTLIHRAYRQLARQYHPDVAVGPDATNEEREAANQDFIRINTAYEDIKSRQDEEEIEVVMMGGNFGQGKRDRRVKYKTSEKIREQNPNKVNYNRIVELQERKNLKARSWRDPGEFDYQQGGRHNGDFGPVRRW